MTRPPGGAPPGEPRPGSLLLVQSLAQYPDTELLIVGHTDATGSESYDQGLSDRRARAAPEYQASLNVGVGRMHASGRGEWEPPATDETEAGRQANLRIAVAIYAGEAVRVRRLTVAS